MPVVFQQPDPFSASISAQYGATEQFDKTLPVLSSMYEQQQNRNFAAGQALTAQNAQAQAQTAHNREAAYQTDVQSADRFEAQRREQAQQLEVQARSQQFQAAMQDRQLTYADQIKQQERQNALTAIQEAVANGTLTKEEAGPYALKIRTGIDTFRMQQEKEAAENQQALAKLHLQQAATQHAITEKNANLSVENFSKNTVTTLDPQAQQAEEEKLRPKYQALAAVIGADAAQQAMAEEVRKNVIAAGRYEQKTFEGYDSHGQPKFSRVEHTKPNPGHDKDVFDSQLKHYESSDKAWQADQARYDREYKAARAEANKLSAENGGWSQSKVKDETERLLADQGVKPPGPRPTMPTRPGLQPTNQPTGQTAPPNTPGQEAQAQNDQRGPDTSKVPAYDTEIEAIKSSPYNDEQKQQATGIVQGIRQILAKGPKMTAEDRKSLVTFRNLLKSYQAIKWE
jgi:hypothetical protein